MGSGIANAIPGNRQNVYSPIKKTATEDGVRALHSPQPSLPHLDHSKSWKEWQQHADK